MDAQTPATVADAANRAASCDFAGTVELIGDWIWLFPTARLPKPVRVTLKSLGFHPHSFRKGVWIRPGTPTAGSRHRDLDELRVKYGTVLVKDAP